VLSDHDLREAFTAVRVQAEERATPPPLRTVLRRTGRRLTPGAVVAAAGLVLAGSWTTVGLLTASSPADVVVVPMPSASASQPDPVTSVATSVPRASRPGEPSQRPSPVTPTGTAASGRALVPSGPEAGRGSDSVGLGKGPVVAVGTGAATPAGTGPSPRVDPGPSASGPAAGPAPTPTPPPAPTPVPSPAGTMTVTVWLQQGGNCALLASVSRTVVTTGPQESRIDAALRAVLDGVTPAEAAAGYASPFSPQVLADATVTVTPPASVRIDLATIAPLEAIPLACRASVLNAVNQTALSAGVVLPITWTIAGYPAPIALWLAGA